MTKHWRKLLLICLLPAAVLIFPRAASAHNVGANPSCDHLNVHWSQFPDPSTHTITVTIDGTPSTFTATGSGSEQFGWSLHDQHVWSVSSSFHGGVVASGDWHPCQSTTIPETTPPPTTVPETTVPETTAPETTVPETQPPTTIPDTTVPETTVPTTKPPVTTTTTPVDRADPAFRVTHSCDGFLIRWRSFVTPGRVLVRVRDSGPMVDRFRVSGAGQKGYVWLAQQDHHLTVYLDGSLAYEARQKACVPPPTTSPPTTVKPPPKSPTTTLSMLPKTGYGTPAIALAAAALAAIGTLLALGARPSKDPS